MERPEKFANGTPLQFALREMQRLLNAWPFWIVLLSITAMLAVAGPFNTLEELSFAPRLAYWASIAVLTALPSFLVAFAINRFAHDRGWPLVLTIAVAGLAASVPVTFVVWIISAFIAGNGEQTVGGLVGTAFRSIPIAVGITAIYTLLRRDKATVQAKATDPAILAVVPFLDRLSPEMGRVLLTLQAQDHYVEVVTTRGKELVLVRLADAERELDGIDGMRVHRSWWVARAAVSGLERSDGKVVLVLTDGRSVPVSRANEKTVRAWLG